MGLRLIPSSGAAMAEGGIAFQVSGQDEAGCGELVTDEPEPEQPSPHGVFGILHLGLPGACGFDHLRHLAQSQAKLDVGFKLAAMQSVLFPVAGVCKLKTPELNGALGKAGVVIQDMVSAAIVMVVSIAVRGNRSVPNVGQLRHGPGFPGIELIKEMAVNRVAIMIDASLVEPEG